MFPFNPGWEQQDRLPRSQYADQHSAIDYLSGGERTHHLRGGVHAPVIKTRGLFDPPVFVRKVRGAP